MNLYVCYDGPLYGVAGDLYIGENKEEALEYFRNFYLSMDDEFQLTEELKEFYRNKFSYDDFEEFPIIKGFNLSIIY